MKRPIFRTTYLETQEHGPVLEIIARNLPAKRSLEIGVRYGGTTMHLLSAMREIQGHLWSVDIKYSHRAHRRAIAWGVMPYWTFTEACSWDWTPPGGLFDLAFIDGDHANVAKDWEKFEPLVRPGGILLLHDYIGPQSQGPRTLVDEVIRPQWQRWECATLPYSYGLTIVRKR